MHISGNRGIHTKCLFIYDIPLLLNDRSRGALEHWNSHVVTRGIMTSTNALSAGGGSGVGWQVDIPGLSSLILGIGAAGLKQLASAGVDLHTIGCMLKIAGVCPASNEYRREITSCRQVQRKDSVWLYKIVELGTATNFVADELLKTRAGENVVALMSATLPVMSEQAVDNLLVKLFETSGASMDHTPSFGQLESIRTTLAPLARKTHFKDKTFQYHMWFKSLVTSNATSSSTLLANLYDSIPSEETAVQIIRSLVKAMQDSKSILVYYGLKGAAWLTAYARHVLDLPVCVVRTTNDAIPISGDYKNAKVLLYIFEDDSRRSVRTEGKPEDFFVLESLKSKYLDNIRPRIMCTGWSIDTMKTNVADLYLLSSADSRDAVSNIVRSLVNDFTKVLANSCQSHQSHENLPENIFTTYKTYCLPAIRKRAARILRLLGFECDDIESVDEGRWSEYFTKRTEMNPEDYDLIPNLKWIQSRLGYIRKRGMRRGGLHHDHEVNDESFTIQEAFEFDGGGIRLTGFLVRVAKAASWLAFTNWDQTLRMMSVDFLVEGMMGDEIPLSCIKDGSVKSHPWDDNDLCLYAFRMCIGPNVQVFRRQDRYIATHVNGLIIAKRTAIHQVFDYEAIYVSLFSGAIVLDGQRHDNIIVDGMSSSTTNFFPGNGKDHRKEAHYRAVDMFPTLEVLSRVERSRRDIVIYQELDFDGRVLLMGHLGNASRALEKVYVMDDCHHGYDDECSPNLSEVKQGLYLPQHRIPEIYLGLDKTICYIQAVDQNPVGQWLAWHNSYSDDILSVVQTEKTCLSCVYERLVNAGVINKGRFSAICIIPGRLKKE